MKLDGNEPFCVCVFSDVSSINAARQHWWSTHNAKEALQKMGSRKCLDRILLQGLMKRDKNDYVGALSEVSE